MDNADLAKHGVSFFFFFLARLSVIWTVAVIYWAGSLLNGVAEEEWGDFNSRVHRMLDETVKEKRKEDKHKYIVKRWVNMKNTNTLSYFFRLVW